MTNWGSTWGARRSWAAASGRSDACPRIGEIVLVTGRDTALAGREAARCRKPVRLVQGGDTRAESARRGVEAAGGELVAIHDAARPFVSQAVIEAALQGAAQWGAAAPAVPLKDTVKRGTPGDGRTVPASCLVDVTPDRSSLYAVQTPQCFDRDTYLRVSGQLDPERGPHGHRRRQPVRAGGTAGPLDRRGVRQL